MIAHTGLTFAGVAILVALSGAHDLIQAHTAKTIVPKANPERFRAAPVSAMVSATSRSVALGL
jgi:hypothetical protein